MDNLSNFYDQKYRTGLCNGQTKTEAILEVANAYLDGKPVRKGNLSQGADYRTSLFWTACFLEDLPDDVFEEEHFILALARYMGQEKTTNIELLHCIARVAPHVVERAVRYSALIMRPDSTKWLEIQQLANEVDSLSELLAVRDIFTDAHKLRIDDVENCQKPLKDLTPLTLLSYASLYAFEHLLSQENTENSTSSEGDQDWRAINDILIWLLKSSSIQDLRLNDHILGDAIKEHLSPFIFPTPEQVVRTDLYFSFIELVLAQKELNSFMSQSVDAYCYDDSIRFEVMGASLEIIGLDKQAKQQWERNGEKLLRFHQYWFYRALAVFIDSGKAFERMGQAENQELNQLAYVKAMRSQLQLTEVYGLDESVLVESGLRVDLFQALLSIELMTAFYTKDFVAPFNEHLKKTDNWRLALGLLAMGGFATGQNRLPVTWSQRKDKIQSIRPWTVTKQFPSGNAKSAEAILDFWTSDLSKLSENFRNGVTVKTPELFERPVLKIGRYLFQLPWLVAFQNNSSAAINNLRRVGARRAEAKEETQRIEHSLANKLQERGFSVLPNYQPAKTLEYDPGEVDLICAQDGQVLVIEVKSTFLRSSKKDAWLHKHNTLRKAGLQIKRKVSAIESALATDSDLRVSLGFSHEAEIQKVHGWIVDTCIEFDHELFSGFLKVSMEEVLIALRDDAYLLNDPEGVFDQKNQHQIPEKTTLYPAGFSISEFISVIEKQKVWDEIF